MVHLTIPVFLTPRHDCTSLPPHETDGCCPPFSRVGINVDHEKKVDLGVLRGADHDGRDLVLLFSTVDGACVKFKVTL